MNTSTAIAALALVLIAGPALAQAPAARVLDTTSHGGHITVGSMNVRIGGAFAARGGDFAICPQVTGVVPHVGGPITIGSRSVRINGLPAARLGDLIVEVGPPSIIATGAPTVLIGGN